jgi:hypothetical protein
VKYPDNSTSQGRVDGLLSIDERSIPLPGIIVQEEIGRGASGVVFRGQQAFLARPLAIKLWLTLRRTTGAANFAGGCCQRNAMIGGHTTQEFFAGFVH